MARRGRRNLRSKAFKGGFHASAAIPERDLTIQTNHPDGGSTRSLAASSDYGYNRNCDICVDVGKSFPVSEIRAHVHDAIYSLLRMDLSFDDIKRLSHVNESFLETTFKELGLNIPRKPSRLTTSQKLPQNALPDSLSKPCQSRDGQASAFEESIEIAEPKRSLQGTRTEAIQEGFISIRDNQEDMQKQCRQTDTQKKRQKIDLGAQQKCVVSEKLPVHRKTINLLKARHEPAVVEGKNSDYSKIRNEPEVAYSIKPEAHIKNGNIGKIKEITEQTESNTHIQQPHVQESLKTTSLAVGVESPQVVDVKKYFLNTNSHSGATGVIKLDKTQGLQETVASETEEKCSEPVKIGRKLSQKRSDLQEEYNVSIAAKNTIPSTDEDECGKNLIKSDSSFYHDPEFRFFHAGSIVTIEKKPTITTIVDQRSTTLQNVNEEPDSTIYEHRTKKKEERGKTAREGMSNISDTSKRSLKQTSVVKKSAIYDSSSFDRPVSLLPENDLLSIELEVRTLMLKTKTEIFKLSGLMNDKSVKKQLSDPRVRRSLLRTRDEIFDDVNRLFSDLLTEQNDCCS
ncbi:hypothetical protein SUVZ_15G3210 [Saccharomyces uvarum]|uniref:Uncharacterized protein n=1 Tax=Saccharomyces uvarum TaxID=230603 RepID=A0ABN8WLQ6_SACUV|nr:hypothetical protein SUVZ_15G3210 [Saccharomyces uvarum]